MDKVRSFFDAPDNQKNFFVNQADYDRANEILNILPAKVVEKYGDDAKKWFSSEAINTLDEITFDNNGTFTTKDDDMFGKLLEEDFGCEITFAEDVERPSGTTNAIITDDASCYTFSSELGNRKSSLRKSLFKFPTHNNNESEEEENNHEKLKDNGTRNPTEPQQEGQPGKPTVTPQKQSGQALELDPGANTGIDRHSMSDGISS